LEKTVRRQTPMVGVTAAQREPERGRESGQARLPGEQEVGEVRSLLDAGWRSRPQGAPQELK